MPILCVEPKMDKPYQWVKQRSMMFEHSWPNGIKTEGYHYCYLRSDGVAYEEISLDGPLSEIPLPSGLERLLGVDSMLCSYPKCHRTEQEFDREFEQALCKRGGKELPSPPVKAGRVCSV
jgi:hypothetical protein